MIPEEPKAGKGDYVPAEAGTWNLLEPQHGIIDL